MKLNGKSIVILFPVIVILLINTLDSEARIIDSLLSEEPTLEELMNIPVRSATKSPVNIKNAPATIYIITEQEIKRKGYTELKDALESIPGMTIINPDFFAFGGQRGILGNFSQTLLLINGREVQNLLAGETFISHQYSLHNVKQIEVINGPGSVLYGANAYLGVINIITKNNEDDYNSFEVGVEYGTENTKALNLVFGVEKNGFKLSGSARIYSSDEWDFSGFISDTNMFSDGFVPIARGVVNEENQYLNRSESIPLSLRFDCSGYYCGVEAYYHKANKGIERVSLDYNGMRDQRRFALYYTGYNYEINDNHKINIEYQYVNEKMNGINYEFKEAMWARLLQDNPDRDPDEPLTQDEIYKYFTDIYSQENCDGSQKNKIELQLKSAWQYEINTIFGYNFEGYKVAGVVHSNNDMFPRNDLIVGNSNHHSAYLQADKSLFDEKLNLILGARFDYHSIYNEIWNLRSGLVYNLLYNTQIKLLFGQAFREPTVFEFADNKNLKPARINTFELSATTQPNGYVLANITLYRNSLKDLIVPENTFVFINSDEIRDIFGCEGQLSGHVSDINLDFRYAFTMPEKELFGGNSYEYLNVYKHKFILGFDYELFNMISFNLMAYYYPAIIAKHGNQNIDEVIDLDSYTKVNLSVSLINYDLYGLIWDFSVSAKNIFDGDFYQPNVRRGGPKQFLQPGRQIVLRTTARF